MSAQQFKYLFSPIKIGPFTVKNRIMVSPHGPLMNESGLPTEEYIHHEIEKAKGGVGMHVCWLYLASRYLVHETQQRTLRPAYLDLAERDNTGLQEDSRWRS